MAPPPRTNFDILIFHAVKKVYAIIYTTGNNLSKRDKLGIHQHIEDFGLELFDEIIGAALAPKARKTERLEKARLLTEKLKHLTRLEYELKIIPEKTYIRTQTELVEISKMTNGWIKYLAQNPPKTY